MNLTFCGFDDLICIMKRAGMAVVLLCLLIPDDSYGAFKRDLIKETQTDSVAVTEELLTRESESGPASPSFKMNDTSLFFVKRPYEDETKEFLDVDLDSGPEFSTENWDDWFHSEEEGVESTEALAQKEVKEKSQPPQS